MLRSEVSARVSVEEALAKEWVRGHASKDPLPEIVVRGLVYVVFLFLHFFSLTVFFFASSDNFVQHFRKIVEWLFLSVTQH